MSAKGFPKSFVPIEEPGNNSPQFPSSFRPIQEAVGKEGSVIGGWLGQAIKGVQKRPEQALKEIPVVGAEMLEFPAHIPKLISKALSTLTGYTPSAPPKFGDYRDEIPTRQEGSLSGLVAERARAGLSPEEQEEAQSIANIESLLLPFLPEAKLEKSVAKGATKVPKTFESGILKPRADESKLSKYGIITPAKQEKVIGQLEEQAQKLSKESLEKHVPFSKKIEEGFDFKKHYEQEFGSLKKSAEKANPEIDITPISDFFEEVREKYRGIPSLHKDAKKAIAELKAFSKRPQTKLANLLKIYRSNNAKLSQIAETYFVSGKQKDYANFLSGMNEKISESFKKTLPEDSAWFKKFREMNEDYSNFRRAEDTRKLLESTLGEKLNAVSFEKIALDPKRQAKLKMKMGGEGAQEIVQLSKDLRAAKDAIKRMKAKDLTKWELATPFALFFPGLVVGKAAIGLYKAQHYARRVLGWYLSKPAKRKAMSEAARAIAKNDYPAYLAAVKVLNEKED